MIVLPGRSKVWMAGIGVLAVGIAYFTLVRMLVPASVAGADPDPFPLEEASQHLAESTAKPLFVGEINGITFKEVIPRSLSE